MTDLKPSKTLNQHYLGEEISLDDAKIFFNDQINVTEFFTFPIKLVKITFTIQDSEGTQMDYSLKSKLYEVQEDD